MKKELITFDKDGYNYEMCEIKRCLEYINQNIRYLLDNDHKEVTMSDFIEMRKDFQRYKANIRNTYLEKICDVFGITLDMVFANIPSKYEEYVLGANSKVKYLNLMPGRITYHNDKYLKYFNIVDNIAYLNEDAEDLVRDKYSYYSDNAKQIDAGR